MWRCIIHSLSYLPHCLLWNRCNNKITSNHNFNCTRTSIDNLYFGCLQRLPKHCLNQYWRIFYLSLPHTYLEWFKIKRPKHPLASRNSKELWIQAIKIIQGKKPAGEFFYDLLKYVIITFKIIRISSDHAVFSRTYKTYKPILALETYDILMATQNNICFKRPTQ